MNRRRRTAAIALTAIAIAIPAIAIASSADDGESATVERETRERPSFPMEGESFVNRVEQRIDKMEARMEARLADSDIEDGKKEAIRTKFATRTGVMLNAAETAAADGTVTKDEAKALRKSGRKGKRGKRGKKGKRDRAEQPEFPMAGPAFMSHVEQRIAARQSLMDERLERSNKSDEDKANIRAAAAEQREAMLTGARAAAADGTVTKEEAKALHQEMREARRGNKERDGRKRRKGGEGRRGR